LAGHEVGLTDAQLASAHELHLKARWDEYKFQLNLKMEETMAAQSAGGYRSIRVKGEGYGARLFGDEKDVCSKMLSIEFPRFGFSCSLVHMCSITINVIKMHASGVKIVSSFLLTNHVVNGFTSPVMNGCTSPAMNEVHQPCHEFSPVLSCIISHH
jgi:hypothetical protein